MLTDEQARRIALFFLFSLVDENVALQAAHKAAAQVKALGSAAQAAAQSPGTRKNETALIVSNAKLIEILRRGFDQHRKLLPRNRPMIEPSSSWVLPTQANSPDEKKYLDVQGWFKFQKDAAYTEIVAVVLSKILGFDEYEIAEGLNISIGTARYRIGKGVRQLGLCFVKTAQTSKVSDGK